MKRSLSFGLLVLASMSAVVVHAEDRAAAAKDRLAKEISAASGLNDKAKAFVQDKLLPLCTNPVFVAEVKAQNGRNVTLAEIQALDQQWIAAEDELPIQKTCLTNACAQEVKRVAGELKVVSEMFVMDNQGANVGQNTLTEDYWQGDEPKWQNSFNSGKGGIDAGKVKFDKSANCEDQKISLPIIDEQGQVIGAVCVGVRIDKI